jgi:hypothetical protein
MSGNGVPPKKESVSSLGEKAAVTHHDADKSATSQRTTKQYLAQENRVRDPKLDT